MKYFHAIIGCGRIAPSHVYGCISNSVEIKSCFDINQSKAREFASIHNIPNVANSFQEILNDKDIISVSICTDHKSHAELSLMALNAGKNVIVEKPMALSLNDAKKMISTAKKHKKVLMVISQNRYTRMIQAIKRELDNKTFGKITLINALLNCQKDTSYYTESDWKGTKAREGGSTLINQAIHTLDLVLWIKGIPQKVRSLGSNLKFNNIIETEDTFAGIMKMNDDSLVVISATNTSIEIWDSKVEIIGTKGSITFSVGFPPTVLKLKHEDKNLENKLLTTLIPDSADQDLPPSIDYYGTTHREQMADFFNVVTGKSTKLFMNPTEALNTLSVVLELYEYH